MAGTMKTEYKYLGDDREPTRDERMVFKVAWISSPDSLDSYGEIYYGDPNRALAQFELMTRNEAVSKYYEGVSLYVMIVKEGVTIQDLLNGENAFLDVSAVLKDWSRVL